MSSFIHSTITDLSVRDKAARMLHAGGVKLPTFSELANPKTLGDAPSRDLQGVDPDTADAKNLFRVHWYNSLAHRGVAETPEHVVLPSALSGVEAKIIVALGNRFPMIGAHKVLAAYGCLAPRLVTGQFDPEKHRAVWPSTGNYCRGGIAISRILGCRGVAVLPQGMSRERFEWLERWVSSPDDIVRTPGTESNVKEIYDACHELARDPQNVILNQFSEFGNYITHRAVTGPALERIFTTVRGDSSLRARAYVCASGSAGTLAAGDYLKASLGSSTCVVEALECPTLLYNGYGEHNIQGIGDKHLPLIHNVMASDYVIGVSDRACDGLNRVFNTGAGREYLRVHRGFDQQTLASLADFGLSSIANILAAIKLAKYHNLGEDDAVLTVATDGAVMYGSELEKAAERQQHFDEVVAAEYFGRYLLGVATDHVLELTHRDRERIFNLGYYTWVEQQGISVAAFDARRDPAFWDELMQVVPIWDRLIGEFNDAVRD